MGRLDALNDPSLLYVAEGTLSAAECAAQIARIEGAHPYLTTDRSGVETVRHNARAVVNDPGLAELIFGRIRSQIPPALVEMVPVGANECIRYYRYQAGDFFKPHQDTHFVRNREERSLLSVVVYLNADFEGGEVTFPALNRTLRPAPGLAVIFGHRMLHESRPILQGTKYAFRSDVMYRRR
jgi:predicted 2-oxoglutarate/Fe(II)-dependent dioxygenase YbiX